MKIALTAKNVAIGLVALAALATAIGASPGGLEAAQYAPGY